MLGFSIAPRSAVVVLGVALAPLVTGCASARFHSKTGEKYPPLATHAVHCDETEAKTVAEAGGLVIGTISGRALAVTSTHDDVSDKAQIVAARSGGTHLVLTEKGTDVFTTVHAGQTSTDCVRTPGTLECQTVSTPTTVTTQERAKARYIVFRLPRERWSALPENLRPIAR